MPTFPFQVPTGVSVIPFGSGNQNLGSLAKPFGVLYANQIVQTGTGGGGGGITGPASSTNNAIAIWNSTAGASLADSKWTIASSVLAPTTSGTQYLGSAASNPAQRISSINVTGIQGCKNISHAWACWDQANGTPTISGTAFNVASLTDGGAGITTVVFVTAMPDIKYSCAGNSGRADGSFQLLMPNILFTTGVNCTISDTATLNDNKINSLVIHSNP